jgi:hypothetical protein
MPRFGTLDFNSWGSKAAEIDGYKTDAWLLKGAQILNISIESDDIGTDALLPPAMHPTIPSYTLFNVSVYPDSPVGRFAVAEVRVVGRAGVRPRGFVLRSFVDGEAAKSELAKRWGYPVADGRIELDLRHDRVRATVRSGENLALECELLDRDTISGADVQYIASMHLARNKQDGKLVLVQVDPEYVFSKAERGKPVIVGMSPSAWNSGDHLKLTNPIAASFAICDVTLPKIRYICDPGRPAFQGTTKVAA